MKINKLITGIFFIQIIAGCSDILDISPRTTVSPDNLGQGEVEQLLNGAYHQLQNGSGRYNVILFDVMGGNVRSSNLGGDNQLIDNDVDPGFSENQTIWHGYFRGIYRTNILIETLNKLEATERNKEVTGIAHFLRAYAYYSLVTRYGGVPILRKTEWDFVSRDSESDVWDFIKEDLQVAIDQAPSFSDRPDVNYVTAEAAKALMARTALALGEMTTAEQMAEEVIGSGIFSLEDNFESIFRGNSNSETIFAFENRPEEGITFGGLLTTVGYPTGGSYFLVPVGEMFDLYEDIDVRKDVTVTHFSGLPMINKYQGGLQGGDPIIISRIAEMYLISAEAQGLAGIGRLNEVKAIRGISDLDTTDEQVYLQSIEEERRRELAYEGFRWYDLIRTGRAIDELVPVTSSDQFKLPIPVSELDLNPLLKQNLGY